MSNQQPIKKKKEYPLVVPYPVERKKRIRTSRSQGTVFRGPLGLWPFPIINFLLILIGGFHRYEVVRDKEGNILSIEEYER